MLIIVIAYIYTFPRRVGGGVVRGLAEQTLCLSLAFDYHPQGSPPVCDWKLHFLYNRNTNGHT